MGLPSQLYLATPVEDVDVIYFDNVSTFTANDERWKHDHTQQFLLSKWSAQNQARMHTTNNDSPYPSLQDAIEKALKLPLPSSRA